jgi:ubiquinone/menaquinone biosynthesis C-methylase UbiE
LSEPRDESGWAGKSARWAESAPATVSTRDAPNQLLIELAGIRPGDRVLDLASGTGEPAISIALHVGAAGSVMATDATAAMLDAARRRAAKLDLKNIRFEVRAMEDLAFEDRSFDAVTCRFGLMHATNPLAGLQRARRMLRPGKKAACMVHGPSDRNHLWTAVHTVAPAFLGIDDSRSFERHFRFSGEGELAGLLRGAGFTDVREKEVITRHRYIVGEPFWSRTLNRGYGDRLDELDDSRKARLEARIADAFQTYLKDDAYELLTSERVAVGTA